VTPRPARWGRDPGGSRPDLSLASVLEPWFAEFFFGEVWFQETVWLVQFGAPGGDGALELTFGYARPDDPAIQVGCLPTLTASGRLEGAAVWADGIDVHRAIAWPDGSIRGATLSADIAPEGASLAWLEADGWIDLLEYEAYWGGFDDVDDLCESAYGPCAACPHTGAETCIPARIEVWEAPAVPTTVVPVSEGEALAAGGSGCP